MKTISNLKRNFPKPVKFAMYLVLVVTLGFLSYATSYANDSDTEERSLETRLADALKPLPDPEPELQTWKLDVSNFSKDVSNEKTPNLEDRLAEALKPAADPAPEVDGWMLKLTKEILAD